MPPLQQQMPLQDDSLHALQSVPVVFIPGIITPAAITFGPLVEVLGPQIRPVLVDYVLYAADTPPSNYHLDLELENIERTAKNAALDRFHLVGYSSGGIIALAFAARCPERVLSLALCEPGWVWNEKCSDEEVAWRDGWLEIARLPADQRIPPFIRLVLGEGVTPPKPASPPPSWMAKRPAGLGMASAFLNYPFDWGRLSGFQKPVYVAYGNLSKPVWERMVEFLVRRFANCSAEMYEGRHHLDAPHFSEPQRFSRAIQSLLAHATQPGAPADGSRPAGSECR
jgi:pimeloyl-ACP methyl ester carboxylesterase